MLFIEKSVLKYLTGLIKACLWSGGKKKPLLRNKISDLSSNETN